MGMGSVVVVGVGVVVGTAVVVVGAAVVVVVGVGSVASSQRQWSDWYSQSRSGVWAQAAAARSPRKRTRAIRFTRESFQREKAGRVPGSYGKCNY
jgi:hypothetical protein